MEFYGQYRNRPVVVPPLMSDEVITEQTGYMTTKQLVEQMVLAGKRLYDYRHGLLDAEIQEGADDDESVEEQDMYPVYEGDMVDEALRIDNAVKERAEKKARKEAESELQKGEKVVKTDSDSVEGEGAGKEPEDARI